MVRTERSTRCPIVLLLAALVMFWANPAIAVEPSSDLASAIEAILSFPGQIENLDDLLILFSEIPQSQTLTGSPLNMVSSPDNPLPNPFPIVASKIPKAADDAIFDFRRSIAKDFIRYAGSPDGTMTKSQLKSAVNDGKLPVKVDPDEYFQDHDKDADGKLSINEFVPTTQEIAKNTDLEVVTKAYLAGTPYPTGNYPVTRPTDAPPGPIPGSGTATPPPPPPPLPPLIMPVSMIEARITDYANVNGFTTTRRPDGKLIVLDQSGNPTPIPPGVLPLPAPIAISKLNDFARSFQGTVEKGPGDLPVVKDKNGKVVPPDKWPPQLVPPYMPGDGPPPPPPPPPPPGP